MTDALSPSAEDCRRTPAYHPLVIVLVAVCVGIVTDRWLEAPLGVTWTAAAGLWVAWLVLWRRGWNRAGGIVLLGAVACWGAAWQHCHWCLYADDELGHFATPIAEPACLEAVVAEAPVRLPAPKPDPMRAIPQFDRTRLELAVTAIRNGAQWEPASGRVRLTVNGHLLGIHTGDRLQVFAQLSANQPPDNPGQFDYAAYDRAERRRCRLWADYPDCVTRLEAGRWWSPSRWLEHMRTRGDRFLQENLNDDAYGLATALLLGLREELGDEGIDPFLETGTIHILSISGLHVGIIAAAILGFLRLLAIGRRRTLLTVAVLTTLYVLLTGAEPPAVRALILVLVMCGSNWLYRPSLPFNSLAASALVVLWLNPAHLFNVGVQLSFLAVTGLMGFVPEWFVSPRKQDRLERLIQESQGWLAWGLGTLGRGAWRLTAVSAVIWFLTLPLVMARFHLLQPVSLAINTLLWLPVPIALVSGFGVMGFGWLLPPLARMCGVICSGAIGILNGLIQTAWALPASHFWVPGPANWWLAGFYGGLGLFGAFPSLRPPRRWCVAMLAGWTAIGFGVHFLHGHRDSLEATFLSVGHGCAVVLRLPNGTTILYDAGQFGAPKSGAQTIAGCLWSSGITHLDAVVISHADADHYNALPELLKRFSVGVVYVSPMMFANQDNRALSALEDAIRRAGVPVHEVFAGDRLQGGGACQIEVLHPPRRGVLGGDNANSIVLAIEYQGHQLLLPGDLDSPGLEDVLAEEPRDCDVLLAPHHGSKGSDPPGLAAWCRPDWVVISGGHRWNSQEATAQYRAAGARVLHTATTGAVCVQVSTKEIRATTFRERPSAAGGGGEVD